LLEEFLQHYQGCILLVTHDRYFMDRLVDHIFVLEGDGNVKDINGNYTDYRETARELTKAKQDSAKIEKVTVQPVKEKKTKLSYLEKKELDTLEAEIAKLEDKKKLFEQVLSDGTADAGRISEVSAEFGLITKTIDQKSLRWLELSDKAEA